MPYPKNIFEVVSLFITSLLYSLQFLSKINDLRVVLNPLIYRCMRKALDKAFFRGFSELYGKHRGNSPYRRGF